MKPVLRERTNEEWLAELRSPEETDRALAELGAYLRAVLARVLRSRAGVDESDLDDFTQDALVRVLAGLDRFRGDSRFTTWATAVAVRTAFTALRRRRFRHRSLDDLALDHVEVVTGLSAGSRDPGRAMDRDALIETLRTAINEALTERQRAVVLGELAGVPTEVLVERLETNPNALYKLHHDARRKLKRALNEAGYTDDEVRSELLEASRSA